jgi:macrolide phosphotransferase
MTEPDATLLPEILALAADHGLEVDPDSVVVNEMGLDFRVALATATHSSTPTGGRWVLRIPRRPEVLDRAGVEARLLAVVAPRLGVAVPDWRIHSRGLIAYPALPGEPGLTLDGHGAPVWHLDIASLRYARSLGTVLAELHAVDPAEAAAAGVEVRDPAAVREQWRRDIATVAAEFAVDPALRRRWAAWLAEDGYWPEHSVLTHGEIYPAHTLVVEEEITAVLDWTTAMVGDPARDFALHQAVAPPAAFEATVQRYVELGGRVWPRLAEHCAELFAAGPVAYGLFALQTGLEEHRQAAQAQLTPAPA